jgi:hypothetical protein
MENPGKIGHKTHHEDKRKKQRKNYNDIFYLHDSNFDVFFFLWNMMPSDGTGALRT